MYWCITRDASLQIQLYNTNSYIYIVQNKKVATSSHYNAQQKLAKYKKHINEN